MADTHPDEGKEKEEQTESMTTATETIHEHVAHKEVAPKVVPIVERTEPPKSYVAILKANPMYTEVSRIVHWRDPVKSGLLFGIFNFFYFLITYGEYSFLTLVSYLLLAILTVCFGYVNYVMLRASWFQGATVANPLKERFRGANFHVSKANVDSHVQTAVDLINTTIDNVRDAFYVSNNIITLKVALYLYAFAVLGKWFNDSTLIYLATLGLFVWPRLYEEKQKEIDQFYGIAATEARKYFQLGWSKIPPNVRDRLTALKEKTQ